MTPENKADLIDAYIEAMFLSDIDIDDEDDVGYDDIAPDTRAAIVSDCMGFLSMVGHLLTDEAYIGRSGCSVWQMAGHDLWLTRNGHWTGFWAGDWNENISDKLDRVAEDMGECCPYIGDDGLVYV